MSEPPRILPVIQPGTGDGSPPLFDKVAIVGLGLIGGSIALAVRQHWPSALVIGVDRKDVLEKAMVLHAIDVAADDPVVMAEADLVILAAPIDQNIKMLAELEQHVTTTAVVTDVGSTKRTTVEAAQHLPARLAFVGGHPLGGAPRGGIEHARPDLFKTRPWIFTPVGEGTASTLERLCGFATALGAEPHMMAPDEHDHLLALVSHLPQLTASALMHVVGTGAGERGLALTGRGLFDSTRLASSPHDIWREICRSNADTIGDALDALIDQLQVLRQDLESTTEMEKVFQSAADWRTRLADLRPPRRTE
ncbi:MAG: prephenate dehydrogenase/arogenate dehydrogenase family protein [Vicinamibacterales bacterium]|nr:prephenate dehydrogenase/arogenate dehydrogenase family protein [Vicinamibacterales bacterium]